MPAPNILDDYQLEQEFCEQYGMRRHTTRRYRFEPNGIPYAKFNGKIYIHIPGAREWLARRTRTFHRRHEAR